MIVLPEEDVYRLVTQPDHAHLAGEILSLWRGDGLPSHPRRREILRATRQHDNGWQEADAAPRVDPETGQPHDFLSLPDPVRREVWRRGARRLRASDPPAALLVTRHALELHRDRRHHEAWSDLLEELEESQRELMELTGRSEEELRADYRFLRVADTVSLVLCGRRPESFASGGYRGRLVEDGLVMEPLPLAGATTFRASCRRVPRRTYLSDGDLAGTLAESRWEKEAVRIRG